MKKVTLFLFTFLSFSVAVFAQEKQKPDIQYFLSMSRISSPEISPDGKWVAYVVNRKSKWDASANADIWISSLTDRNKTYPLTTHDKPDNTPKWSPDGKKIAFFSSRDEGRQIYWIDPFGGEAQPLTRKIKNITSFEWAGNNLIAYATEDPVDSLVTAREDKAGGGYVADSKNTRSSLWLLKPGETKAIKVTGGKYHIKAMAVSPDGNYFLMAVTDNSMLYLSYAESRVILTDKNGHILFTFDKGEQIEQPSFSPDGKHFAFVCSTVGYSAMNSLFVGDIASKTVKDLTSAFDPTILSGTWSGNSSFHFLSPRHADYGIFGVNISNGEVKTIVEPKMVIGDFSANTVSNKIAFTASTGNKPAELYVMDIGKKISESVQLTDLNPSVKNKRIANTMLIKYPSFDGYLIEAVVTLPVDYVNGKSYPMMVKPHGGPDGIARHQFSYSNQVMALENIMVFEPNFRGGIGYGTKFYEANRGLLGDIDFKDIMAGVDYMVKEGYADNSKLLVGGWSYGGYMTNWIIGHSDRFKAAVSVAGIANTISMYGQGDINHSELARWEYKGVPVTDIENYNRCSPFLSLKNCKIPTLILHGEADDRVHVMQAWELYHALKDAGATTELVLYPGAGHSIAAPKQHADVWTRWVEWYKKYLGM